jgi:hypothetical protein
VEMTRAVLLQQPCWLQSLHTGHKLNTHTLTCRNQRCGQTLIWQFQYWELRTYQQLECWVHLTLNQRTSTIAASPTNARNANIYFRWPSFGNADSPLFLTAQCLNTESIMKAVLCHICV